jgi:two-component system response regulator
MAPRANTSDGTPSRKVFWAEDALDDQFLIRTAVEALRPRPEVAFFDDGDVLMEALRHERPRLVVLDIRMPRLDGIATLRQIRAVPGFHNLPVVMFSTAMIDDEVKACQELKARDFVQKPAHYAEFAEAVARVVGGKPRTTETAPAKVARRILV